MKYWDFRRSAESLEVVANVVLDEEINLVEPIVIDLHEPERVLPNARLRMDRLAARALAVAILGALTGCSVIGRMCDEKQVALQYTHVSHPFAGWPFGEKDEEDAVHTVGPVGRCTHGRSYVDIGVGYKVREAGFYGPEVTGTVNVGITLWKSQ
jgi:hypothetical protein